MGIFYFSLWMFAVGRVVRFGGKECFYNVNRFKSGIVLSVEGNIGAGKSTLLDIISDYFGDDLEVYTEPVEKWKDIDGVNILDVFYKDPKRYAYTFQSYAFITRMMELQRTQEKPIRLLERSPLSDYCFAKNCWEIGHMNDIEWKLYQEWWRFFVSSDSSKRPDGIIYLYTTPEICLERVNRRKRDEEENMDIGYLQLLHKQHEDWFQNKGKDKNFVDVPFIILDGTEEFQGDKSVQSKMLKKIDELVLKLKKE